MAIAIQEYFQHAPTYRDYDAQAPVVARALITTILETDTRLRVEHVGSSSVPGCGGKGYIDLLVTDSHGELEAAKAALAKLGFQRQGSREPFPEDRPMRVGSVEHGGHRYLIHAHVVAASAPEAEEMIWFRDRLRCDAELTREYEVEKRRILSNDVRDGVEYAERKGAFVQAVLELGRSSARDGKAASGCIGAARIDV